MKNLSQFNSFAKGKSVSETRKGNNAVIYTRVSTKEQADNNQSLETQKKYCLEFAQKNNLSILGYFGGTYESAKTDERKEFSRMMKFVKKQNSGVSFILVYSLDRFSRSGENAIFLNSELRKLGIEIKSVTSPIDASTDAGQFQQGIQLLVNQFENNMRKQKCVDGMKEKLKRGEWMGVLPKGYSYTHQRGEEQKIEINKEGNLMEKAFMWKATEDLSNTVIVERLKKLGMDITVKCLTETFRNPFYCGLLSHSLLEGEVVEGKQPKLISKELFLRANSNCTPGKAKHKKENDFLHLKQFVKCDTCGTPFTGYLVKKKNIYYYKCNKIGCGCNGSAKSMHEKFQENLKTFSPDKTYIELLKKQLEYTYHNLTESSASNQKALEMRISDLKEKIGKVEKRFAFGEIDRSIYDNVAFYSTNRNDGVIHFTNG